MSSVHFCVQNTLHIYNICIKKALFDDEIKKCFAALHPQKQKDATFFHAQISKGIFHFVHRIDIRTSDISTALREQKKVDEMHFVNDIQSIRGQN